MLTHATKNIDIFFLVFDQVRDPNHHFPSQRWKPQLPALPMLRLALSHSGATTSPSSSKEPTAEPLPAFSKILRSGNKNQKKYPENTPKQWEIRKSILFSLNLLQLFSAFQKKCPVLGALYSGSIPSSLKKSASWSGKGSTVARSVSYMANWLKNTRCPKQPGLVKRDNLMQAAFFYQVGGSQLSFQLSSIHPLQGGSSSQNFAASINWHRHFTSQSTGWVVVGQKSNCWLRLEPKWHIMCLLDCPAETLRSLLVSFTTISCRQHSFIRLVARSCLSSYRLSTPCRGGHPLKTLLPLSIGIATSPPLPSAIALHFAQLTLFLSPSCSTKFDPPYLQPHNVFQEKGGEQMVVSSF